MEKSNWCVVRFDGQKLFDTNSYPLEVLATFKGFDKNEVAPFIVDFSVNRTRDLYDEIVNDMKSSDDDEIEKFKQSPKMNQINVIKEYFEESWKNHNINSYALVDSKETMFQIFKCLGKVVKVMRAFHKNEI
jgi:hypothetical protein